MNAPVWKRNEIESPCVQICVIHPETKLCSGCHRSMDEITQWSRMSVDQRRVIMAELPQRAAIKPKRRGGRDARLKREF